MKSWQTFLSSLTNQPILWIGNSKDSAYHEIFDYLLDDLIKNKVFI